jgi:hypothetical protein
MADPSYFKADRPMLLSHHSRASRDLSRSVSGRGQLFVACVVVLMILGSFGEVLEPALMSELELDILASELGLESILMNLPSWNLVELLLAGLALAAGLLVIGAGLRMLVRALFPADPQRGDKVPILTSNDAS